MNKLMGFYELQKAAVPTIRWSEFTSQTKLNSDLLWTLRVALESSSDLNLPRYVGVNADEAYKRGMELVDKYNNKGIVIYYPYFIAEKSGVLEVSDNRIVIEAVKDDLWNFVTYGKRNVTIIIQDEEKTYFGQQDFLLNHELILLKGYAELFKRRYRHIIAKGSAVLAEWSFAFDTDITHKPLGKKHLIFYELRSLA